MLKIIIQSTPKCVELLKFINKDIDIINRAGFQVKIEIATQERIEMLANNNINRLPVMIAPDKSLVVGINEIIDLISKNINAEPQQISRVINRKIPRTKKSVDDYLYDAIYEGVERSDKGLIAKQEKEDDDDDHFDFDKERKKKGSQHSMKHRQVFQDESSEEDPMPKKRKPEPKKALPKKQQRVAEDYDNSEEDNVGAYNNDLLDNYGEGGNDMDSKMMNAMLGNLG